MNRMGNLIKLYIIAKVCGAPCHDECWIAKYVKIFGKKFNQHSRDFINPGDKASEHIMRLIEYSKHTMPYAQQYNPNLL